MGPSTIWAIQDWFMSKILMSRIQHSKKSSFSGFEPVSIREISRWIRIWQRFLHISNQNTVYIENTFLIFLLYNSYKKNLNLLFFTQLNDGTAPPLSHINILFRALYTVLKINLDCIDCLKIGFTIKKMFNFFAFLTFLPPTSGRR